MKMAPAKGLFRALRRLPSVTVTRKLHSANFRIRNKVFAFTKGCDVVLKLPPARVERLIETGTASRLVMGSRTMKEWVVLPCPDKTETPKHLPLFEEAMAYVSSGRNQR